MISCAATHLLAVLSIVAAQPTAPVRPAPRPALGTSPAASPAAADQVAARRKAWQASSDPFFAAVLKGEYASAMDGLTPVFAINDAKRAHLAERMTELDKRLGRAVSHEVLRERVLPGSQRVVAVYYATYHPLKPAVWEIVYYLAPASADTPERWMITSLRFETEQVFEWLEGRAP
jgi:hypothetical protein